MLKKILVVVVALFVVGALFGEDDEVKDAASDVGSGLTAEAEADDSAADAEEAPEPQEEPEPEQTNNSDGTEKQAAARAVKKPVKKASPRYLVTRVIDGDTIELANGEAVRFVGIDTPERGECGYAEATANMERLVLGKRVRLTMSDEDRDRYDRLLRYVNVGGKDTGLKQINRGLAIARYDSRDGYGYHPRENKYIAADKATPNFKCAPKPKPKPQPVAPAPEPAQQSAYYENCTAAREAGAAPVYRGDPGYGSHLDRDGDGVACE
jgi:endonuclease YncB( thermonuclease family)